MITFHHAITFFAGYEDPVEFWLDSDITDIEQIAREGFRSRHDDSPYLRLDCEVTEELTDPGEVNRRFALRLFGPAVGKERTGQIVILD